MKKFKSPLISESPGPSRPVYRQDAVGGFGSASQPPKEGRHGNPLASGHSAVGTSLKHLCGLSSTKHTMVDFFVELSDPHHPVYGNPILGGGTDTTSAVHSLPTQKASTQKYTDHPSSSPEGSHMASFAVPEVEVTYRKLPHPLVLQLQVVEGSKGVARVQTVYGGGWFHSSTMYCKLVKLRQQIVDKIANQEEKLRAIKKDWEKKIPRNPSRVDQLPQYQKEMKKLQDFQTMMSGEGYLYLITKPRIIRLPNKMVPSSDGVLVPSGARDGLKNDTVFGPENNFCDNFSVDIGFENMSIKNMNQLLFADGSPFVMPEFDMRHQNVLAIPEINEAVAKWVHARRQERSKRRDSSLISDRTRDVSPIPRTATRANPHDNFVPLEPIREHGSKTIEPSIVSIPATGQDSGSSKKEDVMEKSVSMVASSQAESKKIDFVGLSQKLATAFSQPNKSRANRPISPIRTQEVVSPRRETPQTPTWPVLTIPKLSEKSQMEPELDPLEQQAATSSGQALKSRSPSPLQPLSTHSQPKPASSHQAKPASPNSAVNSTAGPSELNTTVQPSQPTHPSSPPTKPTSVPHPPPTELNPLPAPPTYHQQQQQQQQQQQTREQSKPHTDSQQQPDHSRNTGAIVVGAHAHTDDARTQVQDADESDSVQGVDAVVSVSAGDVLPAVPTPGKSHKSGRQEVVEDFLARDDEEDQGGRFSPSPKARRTGVSESNRTVLISGAVSHMAHQRNSRERVDFRGFQEKYAKSTSNHVVDKSNQLCAQERLEEDGHSLPVVNRLEALEKEIRSLKERMKELEAEVRQNSAIQLPRAEQIDPIMLQRAMDKIVNLSSPPIKIDLSQTRTGNIPPNLSQSKLDSQTINADRERSLKNRSLSNPQQTPMLLESYIAARDQNETKSALRGQPYPKKSITSIVPEKRNNSNESHKKLDKGSNEKLKQQNAKPDAAASLVERARNPDVFLGKRTSQIGSDSLTRKQTQPTEQPKVGIPKDRIRNQVYSLSGSGNSSSSDEVLQTARKTKYPLPTTVLDHSFVVKFTKETSITVPYAQGRHHARSRPASNESAKHNQPSTLSPDIRLLSKTTVAGGVPASQPVQSTPLASRPARKSPLSSSSAGRIRRSTPVGPTSLIPTAQQTANASTAGNKPSQTGYPLPSQGTTAPSGLRNKRNSPPSHTLINQYASRIRP